ncbi:MAG: amino acid permease [Bryobacteraceae bacterium]|nr:amino acid permease [Bryobacteraceae bacterium]
MATTAETKAGLIKGLGLLDATTIVMGSMIGSGIFIVAADIARQTGSPGLMMMPWVVTTVMTLIGAISYGELAAMMPRAGGQYVYLREAFGPLSGFLYGWTMFLVIQTGTIAAVAMAFARYTAVLIPWFAADNYLLPMGGGGFSAQHLLAIAVILVLTWVNTRGLREGAIVQNLFTIAKTGALVALAGLGLFYRNPEAARNFTDFWGGTEWGWTALQAVGVSMVGALFSADAWNNVTFTGEEVRNPKRNLPLALGIGVSVICLLYLATNLAYLHLLPLEQIQTASEDRVATAAVSVVLGPSAVQVMAIAIMVSTFGCINGLTLAGARIYYAMARDGLFFRQVARVDAKTHTPVISLVVQGAWACLLTLSGTYSELLDYVMFAVLLFYIQTIVGVYVLRRRLPDAPRPYRALGYPVTPAIYIAAATFIEIVLLIYKPRYTWPGLIIVLLGIPVYYLWRRKGPAASA